LQIDESIHYMVSIYNPRELHIPYTKGTYNGKGGHLVKIASPGSDADAIILQAISDNATSTNIFCLTSQNVRKDSKEMDITAKAELNRIKNKAKQVYDRLRAISRLIGATEVTGTTDAGKQFEVTIPAVGELQRMLQLGEWGNLSTYQTLDFQEFRELGHLESVFEKFLDSCKVVGPTIVISAISSSWLSNLMNIGTLNPIITIHVTATTDLKLRLAYQSPERMILYRVYPRVKDEQRWRYKYYIESTKIKAMLYEPFGNNEACTNHGGTKVCPIQFDSPFSIECGEAFMGDIYMSECFEKANSVDIDYHVRHCDTDGKTTLSFKPDNHHKFSASCPGQAKTLLKDTDEDDSTIFNACSITDDNSFKIFENMNPVATITTPFVKQAISMDLFDEFLYGFLNASTAMKVILISMGVMSWCISSLLIYLFYRQCRQRCRSCNIQLGKSFPCCCIPSIGKRRHEPINVLQMGTLPSKPSSKLPSRAQSYKSLQNAAAAAEDEEAIMMVNPSAPSMIDSSQYPYRVNATQAAQ